MLFTSAIFLYAFLPLTLLLYSVTPKPAKNTLLAVCSLFFYLWGEVAYFWVFVLSVVANYIFGYCIDRTKTKLAQNITLTIACGINLSLLGYFKYANFIIDNINSILSAYGVATLPNEPIHLPIGISFVTFHALSYLIDIRIGKSTAQKKPQDLLLYLALFPQLIAGPIIRYHQIDEQIRHRVFSLDNLYPGIRRFTFGLAKKIVIANPLGYVADSIFAIPGQDVTTPLAWLGISAYTLQLYFDFSGYSCMAIGLARMFGFHFPENFNYPYIASSVQEFWRRWHISLSAWFRDYVYIPLGGNRHGKLRTHANLIIVFALCGLWHGASWNFLIWGLFHGTFLIVERIKATGHRVKVWAPIAHVYTLIVIMVGWVFFRANTVPHALAYLKAMAGLGNSHFTGDNAAFYLTPDTQTAFVLAAMLSVPIWPWLEKKAQRAGLEAPAKAACIQFADGAWLIALALVCVVLINEDSYSPFIYFRF